MECKKQKHGLKIIDFEGTELPVSFEEHYINVLEQKHMLDIFEPLKIQLLERGEIDWNNE